MNHLEQQMVTILRELKEEHGAISVRAAFVSEGTRKEELLRLKEVSVRAGLGLTLIIGGCESIRDLIEARAVGVNALAGPMIESDYSLRKYLQAVHQVFPAEDLESVEVHANLETITGVRKAGTILGSSRHGGLSGLKGVIIDRADICHSQGLGSDDINLPVINGQVEAVLKVAKDKGLTTTVGGGVSRDSLPFFTSLEPGLLDRFETRKVTFDAPVLLGRDPARGILAALAFELFYLRNKITFFRKIKSDDLARLNVLEEAYWHAIASTFPSGGRS